MPEEPIKRPAIHWLTSTYYRVRTAAYLYSLLLCVALLWYRSFVDDQHGSLLSNLDHLIVLTIVFVMYPHLAYRWSKRAGPSPRREFINLQVDALLVGLASGSLGLPLWITFTMYVTSMMNNLITLGYPGLLRATGLFAVGVGLGFSITQEPLARAEPGLVIGMSVFGVLAYMVNIGMLSYRRNRLLRALSDQLKASETSLTEANQRLVDRLNEIETLRQALQEQADTDPLTGLFNRRYLLPALEREIARHRHEGQSMALLMIDIDHFKSINDRYGHPAGDRCLKTLAQLLRSFSRREDIACRYGGEEFLLVYPKMNEAAAQERAEQLRAAFEQMTISDPAGEIRATLSIGISILQDNNSNAEEMIREGDTAMYAAKNSGRNTVCLYHPAAESSPSSGGLQI